jgi:protein transport protein SEC24
LRIFNQRYQVSEQYQRLFKGIDGTAIIMNLARTAVVKSDDVALPELRDILQDTVEGILVQYRSQCSSSSSTGQLVLPENGKLLPLFLNCLLKSPAFTLNETGKRDLGSICPRGDERAWAFQVSFSLLNKP